MAPLEALPMIDMVEGRGKAGAEHQNRLRGGRKISGRAELPLASSLALRRAIVCIKLKCTQCSAHKMLYKHATR